MTLADERRTNLMRGVTDRDFTQPESCRKDDGDCDEM